MRNGWLFSEPVESEGAFVLTGSHRDEAARIIRRHHYTASVPSGKSVYVRFGPAIVIWSIPANKNIGRFLFGWDAKVWELSRLWAPDGHERNLLTRAIAAAIRIIKQIERPVALVSYADPNAGHHGGVYRAASWHYHGQSEETRAYRDREGHIVARRKFHSGRRGFRKAEIEALGFVELRLPGKHRFVRPLTYRAKRALRQKTADESRM
jgi:hypothetical protein